MTGARAVGLLVAVTLLVWAPSAVASSSQPATTPGPALSFGYNRFGELGIGSFANAGAPAPMSHVPDAVQLSGGAGHVLALGADGTVWASGDNSEGELGNGTTVSSNSAVRTSIAGVTSVSAGHSDSLAVTADGSVWAWGGNDFGQLGTGSAQNLSSPSPVTGLTGIVGVSAGYMHSLAVDGSGTVWSWGTNTDGQLGNGTTTAGTTPQSLSSSFGQTVAVSAGGFHSLALTNGGFVWAWGENNRGQLGDGTLTTRLSPTLITGLSNIVALTAGTNFSAALRSDGTVWTWGADDSGQLGNGTTTDSSLPHQLTGLSNVVAIAAGDSHMLALRSDGTVWAWGSGSSGQLGNGIGTQSLSPIQVAALGHGAAAVAAGDFASYVIGQPYAGLSPASTAFAPAAAGSVSPSEAVTLANTGAAPLAVTTVSIAGTGTDADEFSISDDGCSDTTLAAGASCTVGIRFAPTVGGGAQASVRVDSNAANGSASVALSGVGLPAPTAGLSFGTVAEPAFGAGLNGNGQLGDGTTVNRSVATGVAGGNAFVQVSGGALHSLGLKADGTVWAWGQGTLGQRGDGSALDAHSPVQAATPSGMVAVAAGTSFSSALRNDGTVWTWGTNTYGQLGNGTTTARTTPVPVSGLTNVVAIAAGYYAGYALRSDGTVWAWGYDGHGELGNHSNVTSDIPVQVSGLSSVVGIAGGLYHALAVKSDGTVWAWGSGTYGQLGNGSTGTSTVPVQVSGLTGAVAVAAGYYHSLALLSNGTVKAWGHNANGQLGNNTVTDSATPVSVSSLTNVRQISGGASYGVALKTDGTVWAWGQNSSGQLGIANTTEQHTPAQMTSLGNGGQALGTGSGGNHTLIIGQPHTALSAPILDFASEPVGTPSISLSESVTNNGSVALHVGQAAIVGNDGDEFTITGDGCSGQTVAAGRNCTIGLRFTPRVTGVPAATLRVPSDSPTSPDQVTLDPPSFAPSVAGSPAATTTPAPAPSPAPKRRTTAHAAAMTCEAPAVHPGRLTITCHLTALLTRGRHRFTVRLGTHAYTTITTTRRTIRITLRLRHGLPKGRYSLTITTAKPATKTTRRLALPRVRAPHAPRGPTQATAPSTATPAITSATPSHWVRVGRSPNSNTPMATGTAA